MDQQEFSTKIKHVMRKYKLGILISALILAAGYLINNQINPYKKRIDWLEEETPKYHLLVTQDSLAGEIINVFSTRGFAYILMKDSQRVTVGVSRNGQYEKSFVGDFLNAGDDLYKSPNSDTLHVYRDGSSYYFILGEIINENN